MDIHLNKSNGPWSINVVYCELLLEVRRAFETLIEVLTPKKTPSECIKISFVPSV